MNPKTPYQKMRENRERAEKRMANALAEERVREFQAARQKAWSEIDRQMYEPILNRKSHEHF